MIRRKKKMVIFSLIWISSAPFKISYKNKRVAHERAYLVSWFVYLKTSISNQQPCAFGGRCVLNNSNAYRCICTPGWSGQDCRVNVNDCIEHGCQNGGTCMDEIDGYRLVFKSWWSWGCSATRMSMIVKAVTFTALFLQAWKNSSNSIQY